MKLWQKTTSKSNTAQNVEDFTVGNDREMDLFLAKYDIQGSLAHIVMLSEVGLLSKTDLVPLQNALQKMHQQAAKGLLTIEDGVEDIHSQVEFLLTQQFGDLGKRIHAGRSRNDQVLVDLKLFFRAEIREITQQVADLTKILLQQSDKYQTVLMPGYTHLQAAMVSSFGLWFGAYAETLTDDLLQLQAVYKIVNQNPLGSGAGYGGSLPLNRQRTTELLGFDDLNYNVVHAQMGRGKSEHFVSFAIAAVAHTLAKLAMDICLYMNQNFDFMTLPDELTTGSSIMPHKKNPDVFELIRAKCNRLQSLPSEVALLTSNLPSGYHRDFQLLKEIIFPAIATLKSCLEMTHFMVQQLKIKNHILKNAKYKYLYTVEAVNELVMNGTPFRDAYRIVGQQVENQTFSYDKPIQHTHEGSLGNLCNDAIHAKMKRVLKTFDFEKTDLAIQQLVTLKN
jgi:argininosuccinate lyase